MPRRKDNYQRLSPENPVSGKVFFDQVLERHNIDLKDPANQLMMHITDMMESSLKGHVRCTGFKDGVIYLVCDHPSRASYIRLNSREIKKTISGVFPELDLKKIVTRVVTT